MKISKRKSKDLELLDKLTAKSRLTEKDAEEIANKINSKVAKKLNLKKIFGTLKLKRSVQEMKDEARKGWKPEH